MCDIKACDIGHLIQRHHFFFSCTFSDITVYKCDVTVCDLSINRHHILVLSPSVTSHFVDLIICDITLIFLFMNAVTVSAFYHLWRHSLCHLLFVTAQFVSCFLDNVTFFNICDMTLWVFCCLFCHSLPLVPFVTSQSVFPHIWCHNVCHISNVTWHCVPIVS